MQLPGSCTTRGRTASASVQVETRRVLSMADFKLPEYVDIFARVGNASISGMIAYKSPGSEFIFEAV